MAKQKRFSVSISTDDKTGEPFAAYLCVREGEVAETVEIKEDAAYADYDAKGKLLGVELLAPCEVEVLDKLVAKEPKNVRAFVNGSPPRAMVLC